MSLIIEYIASLAPWIYGLCGLIALYYLYKVHTIRMERRQAIFSLEHERAARLMANVTARVAGLILLMGLTYVVSDVLAQAMEIEARANGNARTAVPADSLPLSAGPVESLASVPGDADVSEVAGATDLRNVPVCDGDNASIQSPGVEEEISGIVTVIGRAAGESFADYRLEIAPGANPADGDFTEWSVHRNQIRGAPLGEIDTTALIAGIYTLRLRIMGVEGEFTASCQVVVRVVSN